MPAFDPDFRESRCPICTQARQGNRLVVAPCHNLIRV
jgi:hypothetical protein